MNPALESSGVIPNRGSRPLPNLMVTSTVPVAQVASGPSSPVVVPFATVVTPSLHQQQLKKELQTQPSLPSVGGSGLQQPPAFRLDRARPHEVNL